MAQKFYAVKTGKTPGIYYDWESCKVQVDGFPKAEYKSFPSIEEACKWAGITFPPPGYDACKKGISGSDEKGSAREAGTDSIPKDSDLSCYGSFEKTGSGSVGTYPIPADPDDAVPYAPPGEAIAYVDGSFNEAAGMFSYGVVFFLNGEELDISKAFSEPSLISMRNVAGEIMGSAEAMRQAVKFGCKKLTIYHDYEGIAKWCTGEWKAKKDWTQAYQRFYAETSEKLEISFVKVKAHSKNRYNDKADELAKQALENA